ncbi:hypothetical protein [Ureaplasma zalophigenitalium]|uniref:Transglutaminase-like domain-containing protein n=1 Tax=Ureaplasma zalophigenitalium TaxID=907723 RepID=A0ABT3BQ29_9BACT|nr:hypothetical protein [Ureaplasma zalophigenitalium]MCV3754341.1 hypothetical protein [Ureaplasma zalophigenitalium]
MKKHLIKILLAPVVLGGALILVACKTANTQDKELKDENLKHEQPNNNEKNPAPQTHLPNTSSDSTTKNELESGGKNDNENHDQTQHNHSNAEIDNSKTNPINPDNPVESENNSQPKKEPNTQDASNSESEHTDNQSSSDQNPNNNVIEPDTPSNPQTIKPDNSSATFNQKLKAAQNKFVHIKNKMLKFNQKKLQMPYYMLFSKNQFGTNNENDQGSWIDDMQLLIGQLKVITKENYSSDKYNQLVEIFDRIEKRFDQQEESENTPTVVFEKKPNAQQAHQELLKEIKSLQKRNFFTEKYDTNEKAISMKQFYDDYNDLISHQYYKFPYLSLGSAATVMFKEKDGNLFTFSASNNQLSNEAKQAMIKYVKEGLDLLENGMSIYEKVFVLTRYVDDHLNYMNNSNGLNDAYIRHAGVCKEYVEQAAILYSMANLDFRIITGEQHIFFAFKNANNKWFITDPTHLDTRPIDIDYPIAYEGSAKLISEMGEMFKWRRHLTWDTLINGLEHTKYLNDLNESNMISEQESNSLFNKQIDPQNESNYHYYNRKFYLVKQNDIISFQSSNKNETINFLEDQILNEAYVKQIKGVQFKNLVAGYKNHLYVIGSKDQQTHIYDINLDDYTIIQNNHPISFDVSDLTYTINENEIILNLNNQTKISLPKPNDYQFNDDIFNFNKRLKLAYLIFGLYHDESNENDAHLLTKLDNIEQLIANSNTKLKDIKKSLDDVEKTLHPTN